MRHLSNGGYTGKPFDKILIANRGEIACRVMRTAKRLGVKTVAVYSDADASAMHVKMADEAYRIGTAPSNDSYLCMDRILEVAKRSGAQGIHPGYGFLSENAKFVDMVEAAGIAFIGPSSAPMHAMGDKISSKKIAKDAGCFVIPGYEGEVRDEEHAVQLANEVGYPVMLKASAGGGGKGMRVAYNDAETREGFNLSKAEAKSSFGDDRMLIERFIEDPHHIEIQVVADTYGEVVAFPERECSVQRRNQKVVEESPSCLLTPQTRRAMQEQAIALCKATGYRSAGTVEMLADSKQNFYFLEMNTRLQVEHPITEMVSGEDLVEHMLYIAAGQRLPQRLVAEPHLTAKGSAIESRVYAEDPLRGFLPSIGPLINYKEPLQVTSEPDIGTVRIDTGVFEGGTISMYYDPMISKLCTHAPTRDQAIRLMEGALDQYVVQGLGNNITFLRDVYRNAAFRSGNYSTKFIGNEYPTGFHGVKLNPKETSEFIALAAAIHSARNEDNTNVRHNAEAAAEEAADLKARHDARKRHHLVCSAAAPPAATHAAEAEMEDEFEDELENDEFVVVLGGTKGKAFHVSLNTYDMLTVTISPMDKVTGMPITAKATKVCLSDLDWSPGQSLAYAAFHNENGNEFESIAAVVQCLGSTAEGQTLRYLGSEQEVIIRTPAEHKLSVHMLPPVVRDFSKSLLCPMPGTLISCSVTVGQRVEIGQQLAVVEAMKMQNVLRAERAGVIKAVNKVAGSNLKVDEVIIEFE